jgi:hypothetical protein
MDTQKFNLLFRVECERVFATLKNLTNREMTLIKYSGVQNDTNERDTTINLLPIYKIFDILNSYCELKTRPNL